MPVINVIYTTAGLAALVDAQEDGFAPVNIAEIGISATAIAGDLAAKKALTVLPAETKRLTTIGGELASTGLIHVTFTDDTGDAYLVRAVGIYTDDDVLLAVFSQAGPIVEKAAGATLLFAFDVPLLDAVEPGTVTVGGTGFSVPPATRTTRGVIELATPEEVEQGDDDERAVTPFTLHPTLRRAVWRSLFLAFGA